MKPIKLMFSLVLGFGLAGLTFSLGQWQTGRAEQKMDLHQRQVKALNAEPLSFKEVNVDLEVLSYRKVLLNGRYDPSALIYIDNRQVNGRPAVQVIQGFKPEGTSFLIPVDRGLLLRDPQNPRQAPSMPTSSETGFLLKATLLPKFAQSAELWGFRMGQAKDAIHKSTSGGYQVWSNFNADEFRSLTGQSVANYVLTTQPFEEPAGVTMKDGFYLSAVKLPEQVAKHKGYAFQWYAMTTVLILLTLFFIYREFVARAQVSKD